ncbi:hypothetical protein [Cyclobacterium amurskyense]|uniref:Lipocalin-like domain-containing protein n=1 Tax=Cyclobacterium amurskyense TaxID=320787 RepID=A0A0H4PF53_9BACT|nr:hypothetical protein [Cyclobacterium amurskyense]AKP53096.1 hypothetical protein CA2015_3719 [Cyclobacterium amurskyense]
MKIYRTLLLTSFLFLIVSCGGDDGEETKPPKVEPSKEELLVKNWEVVSVTSNDIAIEHSGFTISFKSDGKFSFNTPGISGLPQSGTWVFSTTTIIKLNGTDEIHVGELKTNKFVFTYNSTNHKGTNVETRFTME